MLVNNFKHLEFLYISRVNVLTRNVTELVKSERMPFDFSDKNILVTGAGRDFGRAVAKAIAAAGGEVYVLGRKKENIESLVQECGTWGTIIYR